MVVIGLIMIVMTIGIPRLIYNNETPLGGTLSAVMDACAAARTKAILSGQPTKVVVDSENYSVTVGGASIKPKTELEILNSDTTNFDSLDGEPKPTPQTGTSFSGKIHADVGVDFLAVNFKDMLDEGRAEINFYPNGTSDEFAIGMRHITGDGVQRFVHLDSVTGLAYLKTGDEMLAQ
jgi:hypothetical protein